MANRLVIWIGLSDCSDFIADPPGGRQSGSPNPAFGIAAKKRLTPGDAPKREPFVHRSLRWKNARG
jgi:hypothetical protein